MVVLAIVNFILFKNAKALTNVIITAADDDNPPIGSSPSTIAAKPYLSG